MERDSDGSLNTWISLHHTAFDTEMNEDLYHEN